MVNGVVAMATRTKEQQTKRRRIKTEKENIRLYDHLQDKWPILLTDRLESN